MKPTRLLLAGSLAVNVAGAAFFLRHPPPAPAVSVRPPAAPGVSAAADRARLAALEVALASGDSATLAAAGCSPELIRSLIVGRAFDNFQARMRAARPRPEDGRYWRNETRTEDASLARERRLEVGKAVHDFSEAVRRGYGEDLEALFNDRGSRYAFLPPEKREQLRRIEQDYAELEEQINASVEDGLQLPSDREKLALLRREKERDLAAALSPVEREQLELRSSNTANAIRGQFGGVIQSETDYKKLYALQKAFDDRFSNPGAAGNAAGPEARREAEQKLNDDIRATLSPEQIETLRRSNDPDRRTVAAIAQRLNLPANTTEVALATRQLYASQSLQINANPALNAQDRRTQLQALGARSESDLQVALGVDGAQAYLQRAGWVNLLKNGTAFSTNPQDAPKNVNTLTTVVFPVPPPGGKPARPPTPGGK